MMILIPNRVAKWFGGTRKSRPIHEKPTKRVNTKNLAIDTDTLKLRGNLPEVSEEANFEDSSLDFAFGEHNLFLVARALHSLKSDCSSQCFEVAARVRRRDGALLFPKKFTPQLEQLGLAALFDRLLFEKLVRKINSLSPQAPYFERCFISLMSGTLDDLSFLTYAAATCKSHKLSPERFCFKLSPALSKQHKHYPQFIAKASRLGFALCLDLPHENNSKPSRLTNLKPFNFLSTDIAKLEEQALKKRLILETQEREGSEQAELIIIAKRVDDKNRLTHLNALPAHYYTGTFRSRFVDIQWLPMLLQEMDEAT